MGYLSGAGKVLAGVGGDMVSGIKTMPGRIGKWSSAAGAVAEKAGGRYGLSTGGAQLLGDAARKATSYGIYGAAGGALVGGIAGAASQNETLAGGSLNGAGLGAVGGAGVGAVAAAIAKGIR